MVTTGLFTIGFICLAMYATGILRDVYELRLACAMMMDVQRSYADQQVAAKVHRAALESRLTELERAVAVSVAQYERSIERIEAIERALEKIDWRSKWTYKEAR